MKALLTAGLVGLVLCACVGFLLPVQVTSQEDFEEIYAKGLAPFFEFVEKQRSFFLATWKLDEAWVNPSIIRDPLRPTRVLMVWRLFDKGRHDKIGYNVMNADSWEIVKHKDLVEVASEIPDEEAMKKLDAKQIASTVNGEDRAAPVLRTSIVSNSSSSLFTGEVFDGDKKVPTKWQRAMLIGEDARVFSHNGHVFITYNNHLERLKRLFYAKLHYNVKDDMMYVNDPPIHCIFNNESNVRHEKNWVPFDYCPTCKWRNGSVVPVHVHHSGVHLHYSGSIDSDSKTVEGGSDGNGKEGASVLAAQPSPELAVAKAVAEGEPTYHHRHAHPPVLLFEYSLQPHLIVQSHPTGVEGKFNAEVVFATEMAKEDEWKWGEMRGGTPALLVGSEYLAFFHSSGRLIHKHIITYVMGAYTFQRHPPFAITAISPEPLVSDAMINVSLGWAYKVIDFVMFPMGFTVDDDYIHVSWGKNDRDGWMAKFNRTGLLNSLKPVKTSVLGTSMYNNMTGHIKRHTFRHEGAVPIAPV